MSSLGKIGEHEIIVNSIECAVTFKKRYQLIKHENNKTVVVNDSIKDNKSLGELFTMMKQLESINN